MYSENSGQREHLVLRLTAEYEQTQCFETVSGEIFSLQCKRL
jgi:hypothetical protein